MKKKILFSLLVLAILFTGCGFQDDCSEDKVFCQDESTWECPESYFGCRGMDDPNCQPYGKAKPHEDWIVANCPNTEILG